MGTSVVLLTFEPLNIQMIYISLVRMLAIAFSMTHR